MTKEQKYKALLIDISDYYSQSVDLLVDFELLEQYESAQNLNEQIDSTIGFLQTN